MQNGLRSLRKILLFFHREERESWEKGVDVCRHPCLIILMRRGKLSLLADVSLSGTF